jgi:hypothetical protein
MVLCYMCFIIKLLNSYKHICMQGCISMRVCLHFFYHLLYGKMVLFKFYSICEVSEFEFFIHGLNNSVSFDTYEID